MILGMLGQKWVGKDTAADLICREKPQFIKVSLAEPMKRAVMVIFDWTDEHVNGSLKEVIDPFWGISPRQALTSLGTEWAQKTLCEMFPQFATTTGRKLWVKSLLRKYEGKDIVIADIRFQHEVDAIREIGGKIIKIERPELVNTDTHESEQAWKIFNYDALIVNDASLVEYYTQVIIAYSNVNK
jgi:hypothetical protein